MSENNTIIGTPTWQWKIHHHSIIYWLVVLTPLKNISQLGLLFPIYGKNVPNHQPVYIYIYDLPS
jgi:hypothetical protein